MKFSKKKLAGIFVVIILCSLQITLSARIKNKENDKQINQVVDTRGLFNTQLDTVVNRNPTVTTLNRGGNFRLTPFVQTVDFENSNTSNSPNVGYLGTTAEIVDPHVVITKASQAWTVKDTPVHIGDRNESHTITSVNLDNGKTETHQLNKQIPLYGNVQQAVPLIQTDLINYNLKTLNYERPRSNIHEA